MIETIIFVSKIYCKNILIYKSAPNHCVDFKCIKYKIKSVGGHTKVHYVNINQQQPDESREHNPLQQNHFRSVLYFLYNEIHGAGERQTKPVNDRFEWIR